MSQSTSFGVSARCNRARAEVSRKKIRRVNCNPRTATQTGAEHGLGKIRRLCGRETIRAESAQREQTWKRTTRKRARRDRQSLHPAFAEVERRARPNLSLDSSIVSNSQNDKIGFLSKLARRAHRLVVYRTKCLRRKRFERATRGHTYSAFFS